jgi:hypothetical protein
LAFPPARRPSHIEDEMAIHLIGYDTEDEIVSTVRNLRRVTPDYGRLSSPRRPQVR